MVSPKPSAAKPVVASIAAAAASVSVIVNTDALVTTAEVISGTVNVIPALLASPSKSHCTFVRSTSDLTSAPAAAIVSKFVPASTICLLALSYSTPVTVVVGSTVSMDRERGSLELLPMVAVIVSAPSPILVISALVAAIDQSPLLSTVVALLPAANVIPLPNVRVRVSPAVPRPLIVKPSAASAAFTLLSLSIVVIVIPVPVMANDSDPVAEAPAASSTATVNVSVPVSALVSATVSASELFNVYVYAPVEALSEIDP